MEFTWLVRELGQGQRYLTPLDYRWLCLPLQQDNGVLLEQHPIHSSRNWSLP